MNFNKKVTLGFAGGVLLAASGWYLVHRVPFHSKPATSPYVASLTPEQINQRWQEDFRPRVDLVIKLLKGRGLDTTVAERLCDRDITTLDQGDDCINELERLENSTAK